MPRRRSLFALAAVALVVMTGCAPADDDTLPTPAPTASRAASASAPSSTSTATPTDEPAAGPQSNAPTVETISCDTMLEPAVDAELRALDLVPFPKPFTSLGFEPTQAAIECPWALDGSEAGPADQYYGWSAFAPGEREVYLAQAQENGYASEPVEGGLTLVDQTNQPSVDDPLEFLITDEWVAFAPAGGLNDIVWTR